MPARLVTLMLCAFLCLTSCNSGRQQAQDLARTAHFQFMRFETPAYILYSWLKEGKGSVLHVYLEGDGMAFITRTRPSSDPTPRDPVAFRLASRHPGSGAVLYLGRPCQYVEDADTKGCMEAVWTSDRMSERVVRSTAAAIDQAKLLTGTRQIALYGFSGGGGIAALLAQRRQDAVFLGTVAGNLDHRFWTSRMKLTPLRGSLNPMDEAMAVADIPQLHLSGGKDSIIPSSMAERWCAALPHGSPCRHRQIPDMTHEGAWETVWPDLLQRSWIDREYP
jgi:dienelactone hydrolase